jgi:hypothetical protein
MDTPAPFTLTSRRLGALPLIGHFASRMGLYRLLDAWVPADDARLALDPAVVIALVVANLTVEHRPRWANGPPATSRPCCAWAREGRGCSTTTGRAGCWTGCSTPTGAACSPS